MVSAWENVPQGEAGDAMGEEVDNLFTEVRETLMISWCAGTDLR